MSAGEKTVELGAAGAVKPKVESESDKKVQAARQKAIVDAADKENGLTPERVAQLMEGECGSASNCRFGIVAAADCPRAITPPTRA